MTDIFQAKSKKVALPDRIVSYLARLDVHLKMLGDDKVRIAFLKGRVDYWTSATARAARELEAGKDDAYDNHMDALATWNEIDARLRHLIWWSYWIRSLLAR